MLLEDKEGNIILEEELSLLPEIQKFRFKRVLYYVTSPLTGEVI